MFWFGVPALIDTLANLQLKLNGKEISDGYNVWMVKARWWVRDCEIDQNGDLQFTESDPLLWSLLLWLTNNCWYDMLVQLAMHKNSL